MKKRVVNSILVVGMLAALTGCGNSEAAKATPDENGN